MEYEALVDFYNQLSAFAEKGDERGAQKFLEEKFSSLPEEVQGEFLARLYFNTLQERVEQKEIIADIQEKTLAAIEELKAQEK